jgi:hypothetical protein
VLQIQHNIRRGIGNRALETANGQKLLDVRSELVPAVGSGSESAQHEAVAG